MTTSPNVFEKKDDTFFSVGPDPLAPPYLPISFVMKNFPEGDFWYSSHDIQSWFMFCMSLRARAVLERIKSPHKKYQLQIFGDLYHDIQDTPLTAQMGSVGQKEFAIVGTSRKLNPGENIPDYMKKNTRYDIERGTKESSADSEQEPSIERVDRPLHRYQKIPPHPHPENDAYQDE